MMDVNYQKNVSDEPGKGNKGPSRRDNYRFSNFFKSFNDLIQIRGLYSPLFSLIILIGGILFAEIMAMLIVDYFMYLPYYLIIILDVVIMTIIIIPWLYIFSIRPLHLQIQQQQQSESILQSRLRLMEYANTHTMDELLPIALDEIESLTGSKIGFFHFLKADQKTINLQAWSTNTLQNMCKAEGKGSHYDLEQAGVWADAVRQRKSIVHNNYTALAHRKGLPEGHAQVIRELVIPIQRDNKVVAILGLGNKAQDYTLNDVEVVSTFADFAWDIVEHKKADNAIQKSEEKFRMLVDWTYDWEQWMDPDSNIVYISPSCERISGYTTEEFIADPKLLLRIVHPDDRQVLEDHQKVNHVVNAEAMTLEYRIISRNGSERWIEHICRPLFGSDNQHLGRRISNRDITERKQSNNKIVEQSQRELILTHALHTLQSDIGRDLHDTLGNHISFLRMNLEHLSETQMVDPINLKIQIQNMTKAANEAYEMIRAMLAILQTENFDDPPSLFYRYADQIAARSMFQCEFTSKGESKLLSPIQLRQLFYIFREALGNIEKHASANKISGEFNWGDSALTLNISDDGTGFDPEAVQISSHYGLKFMRERAEAIKGSFYIRSIPGRGTTITVVVPYETEPMLQLQ